MNKPLVLSDEAADAWATYVLAVVERDLAEELQTETPIDTDFRPDEPREPKQ
jgi:hypothetical protein